MEPKTIAIIAVVAVVILLGLLLLLGAGGLFLWLASKRRSNPRNRNVKQAAQPASDSKKDCGCNKNSECACDPPPADSCVSARIPVTDKRAVAIYGVETNGCGSDGKLTQAQVQRFVDLHNRVQQEDESNRFIATAERVFSRIKTQNQEPLNEQPIEGDLVG